MFLQGINLKVQVDYDKLGFLYFVDGNHYMNAGSKLDASILSDEACEHGWFTGAMLGICIL